MAFGIGHGGFEAIALVGAATINNLVASVMINAGIFNIPAVIYGPLNISIWFVEAYIIIFAVISIVLTRRAKPLIDND